MNDKHIACLFGHERKTESGVRAVICDSGHVLVGNLMVADSVFSRMKGLLGKSALDHGSGLWLKPCNSVHSFWMKFTIDVVFLDRENRVIKVIHELKPNRITPVFWKAASVIELPAGIAALAALSPGDMIEMIAP